jgi:uncharacterized protein YjbI with pentapeptide repeats
MRAEPKVTATPRRRELLAVALLSSLIPPSLTGCNVNTRKHIRSFAKTFAYLKDPELRQKEKGDAMLIVEDAEFSGERFEEIDWSNIVFKNCDFVGAYEIKPLTSKNVRYEDCRFSGIFSYGKASGLHFLRCAWASGSNAYAGKSSRGVLFDTCKFLGTNPDRNHWGAVGSDGEAEFVKCSAQMFNLDGHGELTLRECELQDVTCAPSTSESGGVHANVLVEHCKLRGLFDMRTADLQSLTIRDTVIDGTLDLSRATVKGDILMEQIRGGSVKAIVSGAQRLIVKSSRFTPSVGFEFEFKLASNEAREVLIEDTAILGEDLVADIGGGPQNLSTVFRNTQITELDLQYVHTTNLLLQGFQADRVRLSDARIGQLEFSAASFARTLDLSGTQVQSFKQTGGTALRKFGGLKLDGSNIKLPG